jgi:tyrosyl-tRNA synthetase
MQLAREITGCFYNDTAADNAQEAFVRTFQQREVPLEMPEYPLVEGQTLLDVLIIGKLVVSRSEGRRLVEQKGVRLDGEVLCDAQAAFPHPGVLQVGRRHFLRVI